MRNKLNILIILCFIAISGVFAKSIKVENITQYNTQVKTLVAGDTIVLANGVWNNAELVFKGTGQKDNLIYLTVETPGKVTLEGASCLRMSGQWLHVSGLVFRNGRTPRNVVVEFRTSSKDYAYNSVLSECVIDKYNQSVKDSSDQWIGIYGKKNTVEYCYFSGKSNEGTTLVVWPNDSNSIENGHLIYRNYFGPRPRLGSNGGETIRIGTSHVCMNSSRTIVDGNYFEQCNGETEIISNKSCDNIFVNNTFFESEGSLVMRHGDRGIVSGNWFIGNGKINTGGVRVINEGHQIYNNFFYKLRGDDFRSALAIMNAIPDSPLNGYMPVKNVVIANNTYYDCSTPWAFGIGLGERNRIVKPESTLVLNNLVYSPNETDLIKYYDQTDGIRLDNNLMLSNKGISSDKGTVHGEILKSKVGEYDMVYSTVKAKKLPYVKYDILGQLRGDAVIGAFQNKGEKAEIEMATAQNCGPVWYKAMAAAEIQKPKPQTKVIQVAVGADNLSKAIKKAGNGDVLVLAEGVHIITNKIVVSKDLTIRSADTKTKPVIVLQSARDNNSFFEIGLSARLRVVGVAINGDSKAKFPAKYVFASAKEGAFNYSLFIENCEIYDVNVATGAIFKAYKGSIADSVVVRNSVLSDSYRGFSFAEEKDNTGKYNVENLVFENTVFNKFTQYVLDYYRGGNDESTLGGSLMIDHCVFNSIGADEKQTILRLTGIVNVSVINSIFNNSIAKTSFRLSGSKNSVANCNFNSTAEPKVEKGAKSAGLLYVNPRFEKKSFELSAKSALKGKATDGGNIGLR
jgi:poly(beta-D-mannuronate) lyase